MIVLDGTDGSVISTLTLPIHVERAWRSTREGTRSSPRPKVGPLQAWNLEIGATVGAYPAEAAGSIAFSPDGATLATMRAEEQVVRLYDVATRQLASPCPPPDDLLGDGPCVDAGDPRCFAQGLAFNGDGSLLAAAGVCRCPGLCARHRRTSRDRAHANVTRSFTADECRRYLHGDCPPA